MVSGNFFMQEQGVRIDSPRPGHAGCLKFPEPESVLSEQGCGDAGATARGTAGLQEDSIDGLAQSDGKDLKGSNDKGFAHVAAAFSYDPGLARKDVLAIAADDIGCFPRG